MDGPDTATDGPAQLDADLGGSPADTAAAGDARVRFTVGSGLANEGADDDVATAGGATPAAAVESEPPAALVVFGDALHLARHYVDLLAGPGTDWGLIGPREAGRLWSRHVLNSAVATAAVPVGARFVDVGSGAGLPGIAMLLARSDLRGQLVEPLQRRADFLALAVVELGLGDRCEVVHGRAEEVVGRVGGADVVTARAVAPLGKLARWSGPLLRTGGLFVALKGRSATDEVARDRMAAGRAGITGLSIRVVGDDLLAEPTTIVLGRKTESVEGESRGKWRGGAGRRGGGSGTHGHSRSVRGRSGRADRGEAT